MNIDTTILQEKKAFITGATGGIGKAISIELAKSGCDIFITASNDSELEILKNSLSKYKVKIFSKSADLKDKNELYRLIEYTKKSFGEIDILINSAGVFPNASLFDCDDDTFTETFDINFRSVFIFTREFAKHMVNKKWGRIVNIGSSSAYNGNAGTSVYCSSKHALLGFSRSVHNEFKQQNVRTFCISPSSTQSKMGLNTVGQDYSTFLNPKDVAKYVIFSISFDSNIVSDEIFLKRMIIR